ncbi:MAG: TolC family protein [Gemmatimonadota bacterium]|nr:TolC family protein [Gemmatimonadota bacterium]
MKGARGWQGSAPSFGRRVRRAVLLVLAAGAVPAAAAGQERPAARADGADGVPTVDLREALSLAAQVDPDYVSALREVGDAAWVRRSAWSAFLLPVVDFSWSWTKSTDEFFNPGTNALTSKLTQFSLRGNYPLFDGGSRLFELRAASAGMDRARGSERQQRFATALATEADYYDVLAQAELLRVARERLRRAEEQFEIARARVLTGAAVQTDSLQLLLEVTRARVDLLRQGTAWEVSRLQLGRQVGVAGPVNAAPLAGPPPEALPIGELDAVEEAVERSPLMRVARAEERRTSALVNAERSAWLPTLNLFGVFTGFGDQIIPDGLTRGQFGFQVNFTLWDGGQRETRIYRAITAREVAEAVRRDAERGVGRDVTEAWRAYESARASYDLASDGVVVARENLRVQDERYRSGATTIIDLVTAQVDLAEAEADLVQAEFETRLALAGIEAILGRRLFAK